MICYKILIDIQYFTKLDVERSFIAYISRTNEIIEHNIASAYKVIPHFLGKIPYSAYMNSITFDEIRL